MARTTLFPLIERIRTLIADTDQTTFTDNDIQDALDRRRIEQRYVPLRPGPSFTSGGAVTYLDFYADTGAWEDDILLQDTAWNTVTPSLSENLVGHWKFASQPNGMAVRATGKTYDLYGSAADLLESWAAKVKLDFSATMGKQAFERQQKFGMIRELAADYRQRALIQTSSMYQGDANPNHDGSGVTYPSLDYGDL